MSRVVSSALLWRQVILGALVFIPVCVLSVFYVAGERFSVPLLTGVLCACLAVGVAGGFMFRDHAAGKRLARSRSAAGATSGLIGLTLVLVALFNGPVFALTLGSFGIGGVAYLVTGGVLELRHRSRGEREPAN